MSVLEAIKLAVPLNWARTGFRGVNKPTLREFSKVKTIKIYDRTKIT
jgi:hypothetical protein